jgi:Mrp family chromosome partitioning ATPase
VLEFKDRKHQSVKLLFDQQAGEKTYRRTNKVEPFAVYGKGGIGKSTTSCNISVALAKRVKRFANRL